MFCKHKWTILSETTTVSKLEHADRLQKVITTGTLEAVIEVTKRKFIQIITCDKCGKVKRFVEII